MRACERARARQHGASLALRRSPPLRSRRPHERRACRERRARSICAAVADGQRHRRTRAVRAACASPSRTTNWSPRITILARSGNYPSRRCRAAPLQRKPRLEARGSHVAAIARRAGASMCDDRPFAARTPMLRRRSMRTRYRTATHREPFSTSKHRNRAADASRRDSARPIIYALIERADTSTDRPARPFGESRNATSRDPRRCCPSPRFSGPSRPCRLP